jgi:hypothetical protein
MAKSYKPAVIEHIFNGLYNPATKTLSRTIVTAKDIQEAKVAVSQQQGLRIKLDSQQMNFMKDLVRGRGAARLWPPSVLAAGYTGEQRTGSGAVFEFVPVVAGTPSSLSIDYVPSAHTPRFQVQSLSIPQASKSLGRRDEPWLLQVAVQLHVLETHFAVGANKQIDALEMSHLQMDLKLRKVQIDAMFLVHHALPAKEISEAIITVEAKQHNQRILPEQIGRQVNAAFASTRADLVIPVAIAASPGEGIYVVEFQAVRRDALAQFMAPAFHRDALFLLEPPVKGI